MKIEEKRPIRKQRVMLRSKDMKARKIREQLATVR